MPYASFDRLNREREENGEPLLANPRNAAAGTLKQQSSAVVAQRGLDCTLYQLAGDDLPCTTHWECMRKASEWGFNVSDKMRICRSQAEIDDYIAFWDEERRKLPFATDGVVIKVNSYTLRRELGFTAKRPDGPWLSSSRPNKRSRGSKASISKWDAPEPSPPSPTSIRCSWPERPSSGPRCTTPNRSPCWTFA